MKQNTAAAVVETPAPPAARPDRTRRTLRERLAWSALEYPIARSANRLPYMLGGLTFFGLVLLVLTGIVLDQYYDPNPLGAHDSIVFILTRVPLGTWLRALHYWGASIVLVSVFLHLIYVFLRRSYQPPREVTWWTGATMLLLLFALAFTGSVLRADQEGGEALAHAVAGAELVGPLGAPLTPDFAASTGSATASSRRLRFGREARQPGVQLLEEEGVQIEEGLVPNSAISTEDPFRAEEAAAICGRTRQAARALLAHTCLPSFTRNAEDGVTTLGPGLGSDTLHR